jgi:hypothetical protein
MQRNPGRGLTTEIALFGQDAPVRELRPLAGVRIDPRRRRLQTAATMLRIAPAATEAATG